MGISTVEIKVIYESVLILYVLLVFLFSTFQPSVTKFEICVSKKKKEKKRKHVKSCIKEDF